MDVYVMLNAGAPNFEVGYSGNNTATASETGTAAPVQEQGGFGGISWTWIVVYVIGLGAYIWFLSRNNKKKEKKIVEMRNSLKVGDSVCTTNGLFGKVAEIGDTVFVIEFGTNRGVRVPVLKGDVIAANDPLVKATKTEKEESQ